MFKLVCVFFVALIAYSKAALPNYVHACKRKDPGLSECYRENFNRIAPMLVKDLPDLTMKAIDPMYIESIHFSHGTADKPIHLLAELTNAKMTGLAKTTLRTNNITIENGQFKYYLETVTPEMSLTAKYKAKGKMLLVNLDTSGNFTINITGAVVQSGWFSKPYEKDGRTYSKFDSDMDIKTEKVNLYFTNLFPGNDDLSASSNAAINENMDTLFVELKPTILKIVQTICYQAFESVYSTFSMEELFPIE